MLKGRLSVVNWNVGGAKFLELKSKDSPSRKSDDENREAFQKKLNDALKHLIRTYDPDIITLQELVQYEPGGDPGHAKEVLVYPKTSYQYFPYWLIDTRRHSHQGKWNKVRASGEWPDNTFFAQGNGILIKKSIDYFPIMALPTVNQHPAEWRPKEDYHGKWSEAPGGGCMEVVKLESGLYFGSRDTEPRGALVVHLVLSTLRTDRKRSPEGLKIPLDIFVIVLHLTTLTFEREGIPDIDAEASETRLRQLNIVLNGIISRYNKWRRESYRIRGELVTPREGRETHNRHSPIWIIAGDFNFTPEAIEYNTMLRRGFIDLIPNHQVGTKTSGLGKKPTLTVDYVFAGPKFEAIDPAIAEAEIKTNHIQVDDVTRVSDHLPLIVDVPIVLAEP